MKTYTSSLALALLLGTFTHISANEDIDTQLSAIKNATASERQVMVQELQTNMEKMQVQERVRVLQKVREQMPDLALKIQNESIAQKIEEIKNADPMQRRELMNSFKQELAQMNEEERTQAIAEMRKQMAPADESQTAKMEQNKEQKRIKEMTENAQMKQTQNMERMEQMNQRQGADQFRQQMQQSGSLSGGTQGFGQKR